MITGRLCQQLAVVIVLKRCLPAARPEDKAVHHYDLREVRQKRLLKGIKAKACDQEDNPSLFAPLLLATP